MGEYNPHVPQILGEEWVPIREEDVGFAPRINPLELGHTFTLTSSKTLQSMRFYVKDPNPQFYNSGYTMAIYPSGREAQTGPIRRVLIPVSNGGITGTGVTFTNAGNVASALLAPDDSSSINFAESGIILQYARMFFATNSYPELANKRILRVGIRYVFDIDTRCIAAGDLDSFIQVQTNDVIGSVFGNLSKDQGQVDNTNQGVINTYGHMNFGDVNRMWDSAGFDINAMELPPWTYGQLQRFEASATNRLSVLLTVQLNPNGDLDNTFARLWYMALEVYYCEETRVVVGGIQSAPNPPIVHSPGVNIVPARSVNSLAANPVLAAGEYLITLAGSDVGETYDPMVNSDFHRLNALREYYAIPTHEGVQVNKPAPLDEAKVGLTFTSEETHVLPQLSVHTSGGPLTEVHAYGRQAVAQVYGSITATQEILDSAAGGAKSWPQVRYYARRFGNTTVPLVLDSPTITGAGLSVQITPNEFDALDEIIDGWKQVTLRFDTPPTMGAGTTPQWRWSATGETAGNRWEVLGCIAPALSGTPGNLFTQVPSPHQLSSATYGAPNSGATVNLGWVPQYAPSVTATSDDQTSDAVLLFAQDMLPVTGMTVTLTSQPVSGIGFDCGSNPCCIPSAIFYNRVQWSPVTGSLVLLDTFSRAATGWGTADTGQTYTDTGGTVPGNYIVTGTQGTHVLDGVANVNRISVITGSYTDSHQEVVGSINVTPAGASIQTAIIGHYVDANNFDVVDFRWATSGNLEIVIANVVAGVQTGLTNFSVAPYIAGQQWHFVADFVGATIRAKAWYDGTEEPADYQVSAAATFTSGGIGIRSIRSTGNTNTTAVASYDDYTVGPSTWNFGSYELQRMDELTDWETIMRATDPRTISFNDFEARVGLESDYRIRAVDLYDFAGSWSSTVSETVDEPGVTIAESCSGGHLLIFTSNSQQDGTSNLAYSTIWDNQVSEDFDFPEAGDVIFQKVYGKDFITAFRPLERGGERFTRTVLVQAAAIDPETLGDFTDLRDMAWAQLPYVCVRDEEGNRWFATVLVPNGRVQLNRTLYMAPVTIQEVTDTPYPVDP